MRSSVTLAEIEAISALSFHYYNARAELAEVARSSPRGPQIRPSGNAFGPACSNCWRSRDGAIRSRR